MKRNVVMMMSLLLSFGMFSACSNDDDVNVPEQQVPGLETAARGSDMQLPDAADLIKEITATGYIRPYDNEGFWFVNAPLPEPEPGVVYFDGGICYFMYNLPDEFKKEGLKVKFTGDAYTCKELDKNGDGNTMTYAGYEYYDVVVKQIEVIE